MNLPTLPAWATPLDVAVAAMAAACLGLIVWARLDGRRVGEQAQRYLHAQDHAGRAARP